MEVSLRPQPPPDVPAPPPGDEANDSRIKMKMICLVGFVSIAVLLVLVIGPRIIRVRNADRPEAINNMKQVGLALFEFDAEYGCFPDNATIPDVKSATSTTLALGSTTSNQLFRQLIATGLKSEKVFWARTATTPRKGNDVLGADTLVKGECAFTYIAGLTSSDDPQTPLLMCPVVPGTRKFDRKPFDGKAIVLFLDSSAKALPIDRNGDVILNGMNLFDPRQPYWKGKAPDIKWPE